MYDSEFQKCPVPRSIKYCVGLRDYVCQYIVNSKVHEGDPALLFWKQCFERIITRLPPPVRVNVTTYLEFSRLIYLTTRQVGLLDDFRVICLWYEDTATSIALHGPLSLWCSSLGCRVFP
jgi:hypothetical protein